MRVRFLTRKPGHATYRERRRSNALRPWQHSFQRYTWRGDRWYELDEQGRLATVAQMIYPCRQKRQTRPQIMRENI